MSELITLEDLCAKILERRAPLPAIAIAPRDALGFVLAAPVVATESLPGFANSAMDGYALRALDTAPSGAVLEVIGSTMAGEPARTIHTGEAVRIMTGAPLPIGADAVCVIEEAIEHVPGRVDVPREIPRGLNVRMPGEDVTAGDVVIASGVCLGPAHLGLLAALGERSVRVHAQPVVGVLSTGDELISDSGPLSEGKIRDANRPALLALIHNSGARALDLGIVGDDEGALLAAIEQAVANCDVLVLSGGASHGDKDSIAAVLEKLAGSSNVHSFDVAIRPARPFVFGEIGNRHTPVFGLPGNPVAALIAFELIAKPAIRKLRGLSDMERTTFAAIADEDFPRRDDGKVHYVRAVARIDRGGVMHVTPVEGQGAHMLASLAASNALVILENGSGACRGDHVATLLLGLDQI
jgi:molybdenum cofactor synthesis domain-containing protein